MNIQDASQLSGLAPATIRFYERRGVLPRPPRQSNGYRSYTADHVGILRFANGLRQLGVPLADAGPVLTLAHTGEYGQIRQGLVGALRVALNETGKRLDDLARVQDHLVLLLNGLETVKPADVIVPGVTPCRCVQLVSGAVSG